MEDDDINDFLENGKYKTIEHNKIIFFFVL